MSELETADGTKCWTTSSEKYVKTAIENVEARLAKSDLRLPYRCDTPMSTGYHPSKDVTREMDTEGLHTYQELIGILSEGCILTPRNQSYQRIGSIFSIGKTSTRTPENLYP